MSVRFWRAVPGEEPGFSRTELAVVLLTVVIIVVLAVFTAPGSLSRIEASREKVPPYVPPMEGLTANNCRLGGIEARSGLDTNHALKTRAGDGAFLTIAGTVLTFPQQSVIPIT